MNVVLDIEPLGTLGSSRTALGDVAVEPVLGALDLVGRILVVIVGVNIEVDDMVPEGSHISLTLASAAGVGWAHVSGDLANNVAESHLVLPHLLLAVQGRDGTQVQMSPGVGRELMTLSIHALEYIDELWGGVNLALVDVVASDEEGSLCVVLLHQVKDVRGVDLLWAIIVGQSNCARLDAAIDTLATVLNGAKLGTGNGGSVGSSRSDVLWATRAICIVAARGVAKIVISATV